MKHKLALKISAVIAVTLVMLFVMFYGVTAIIIHAPSDTTKGIIINKMLENKFTSFIPGLHLEDNEIEAFLSVAPNTKN